MIRLLQGRDDNTAVLPGRPGKNYRSTHLQIRRVSPTRYASGPRRESFL